MLDGCPGNAILQNGVQKTANREIGVPGLQPQVRSLTWELMFSQPSPSSSTSHRLAPRFSGAVPSHTRRGKALSIDLLRKRAVASLDE
jgi:hypothetical protein